MSLCSEIRSNINQGSYRRVVKPSRMASNDLSPIFMIDLSADNVQFSIISRNTENESANFFQISWDADQFLNHV